MKMYEPIEVNNSVLYDSNIPIDDEGYPEWEELLNYPELLLSFEDDRVESLLSIYTHSEGALTEYSPPVDWAELARGNVDTRFSISPDGTMLATRNADYGVSIWGRSGLFFTHKMDISTALIQGQWAEKFEFASDNLSIYISTHDFPFIFKVSLSSPPILSGQHGLSIGLRPSMLCASGNILAVVMSGQVAIFKRVRDSYSLLQHIYMSGVGRAALSHDSTILVLSGTQSPYMAIYKMNSDLFELDEQPTEVPSDITARTAFSPFSDFFSVIVFDTLASPITYSPWIYKKVLGVYQRISSPFTVTPTNANNLTWSSDNQHIAMSTLNQPLTLYSRAGDFFSVVATTITENSWRVFFVTTDSGYAMGSIVRHEDDLYESLVSRNTGDITNSSLWMRIGKVNRWRMFDEFSDSYATGDVDIDGGNIVVRLQADDIYTVYLGGLTATIVTAKRLREDLTVQWEAQFGVIGMSKKTITLDTPTSSGDIVEITVSNSGVHAQIAVCQPVRAPVTIGKTQYGIENLPLDGSRMVTDDFLRTYLRQGRKADIIKASVRVEWSDYDMVGRELNKARAKKYLWDFNEDSTSFESLLVYGFMTNAPRRALNGYNDTTLRIEIQEFS